MQMQVSATRMDLMKVRRRLAAAVRGHSLLKDKLDGLMKEFLDLIARYKAARRAFDKEFPEVAKQFALAEICTSAEALDAALKQGRGQMSLSVGTGNVSGVTVPYFSVRILSTGRYSLLETTVDLDEAIEALKAIFPKLLELAGLEHTVWLLMAEIQRTRRRVNALEYVMIPALRDTLRYIRAKLEENERGNTVRLLKIKEMRLAQMRRQMAEQRTTS